MIYRRSYIQGLALYIPALGAVKNKIVNSYLKTDKLFRSNVGLNFLFFLGLKIKGIPLQRSPTLQKVETLHGVVFLGKVACPPTSEGLKMILSLLGTWSQLSTGVRIQKACHPRDFISGSQLPHMPNSGTYGNWWRIFLGYC